MIRSIFKVKNLPQQFRRNCSNGGKFEFLGKNKANYTPLNPISFLNRSASLFPNQIAYVDGNIIRSWTDVLKRVRQMSSSLTKLGIKKGEVVSILSPNSGSIYECHFSIPAASAIIHTINTRLDARTIAFQLAHSSSKLVFVDREYLDLINNARQILVSENTSLPKFVVINNSSLSLKDLKAQTPDYFEDEDFEQLIKKGNPSHELYMCQDEWESISLNYTSGTTGNPKGVLYHYRGAYLNSIGNKIEWNMPTFSRFLWG